MHVGIRIYKISVRQSNLNQDDIPKEIIALVIKTFDTNNTTDKVMHTDILTLDKYQGITQVQVKLKYTDNTTENL